jgi:hypothetical protein
MALEPVEPRVRAGESIEGAYLVLRGGPLTLDALLRNADASRRRYSFGGRPFVAASAEVTVPGWAVDVILSGRRMRTRRTYAAVPVATVMADAECELLPTFVVPHYSVILPAYTREAAGRLLAVLGVPIENPHYLRRES